MSDLRTLEERLETRTRGWPEAEEPRAGADPAVLARARQTAARLAQTRKKVDGLVGSLALNDLHTTGGQ